MSSLCPDCRSRINSTALACHATNGKLVASIDEADCTERYHVLLHCGRSSYLFSRVEHFPPPTPGNREPEPIDQIVMRRAPQSSSSFDRMQTAVNGSLGLAQNAALLCSHDERELLLYGGEGQAGRPDSGIHRTAARLPRAAAAFAPLQWAQPVLAASAAAKRSGCVDRRLHAFCEFDGKSSAVRLDGVTYLFARANLQSPGGRHVQVSVSADGVAGWSRFRPLEIDGVAVGRRETNIYFWVRRQP
jgi:hypothetical protein